MSDQGSDDDQADQRFDALVKRLLATPPKSRAELAEELRRAKRDRVTRDRVKRQYRQQVLRVVPIQIELPALIRMGAG